MEKVKLPRHVAEALEKAKEWNKTGDDFLAWIIPRSQNDERPFLRTLYEYSGWRGNFFKLIDALRYGYEIEPESITVTITPEQMKKIRDYFKMHSSTNSDISKVCAAVINTVLEFAGIKIPGVNA